MSHTDRIIALIDMDCFYCQVEEKLDPNLEGKPIAVVQYNQWKGGGIIAVNYLARDKGVTRQMRGDDAREKCPEIHLARVPQVRGKADLTKYREAGKKVAEVLMSFTNILERASIDEAYLDITEAVNIEMKRGISKVSLHDLENTFVVGFEIANFIANVNQNYQSGLCDDDLRLAIGGVIVEKIRAEVLNKTGYKCSAGIAHNKILAKLVCGLHKPNKQTILPQQAVQDMFATLPVRKIKSLGGKFGHVLTETLKINYIGELNKYSEKELIQIFDEKNGRWLYNICRGIDREPVQIKLIPKSIGCCKRFPGKMSLIKPEDVEHWMGELSEEISERLEEDLRDNNRKGRLMTVSFAQETNQTEVSSTRAVPLKSYEVDKICQSAVEVLRKNCQKPDGTYHVTFLGLSIGNFENTKNVRSITSFFGKVDSLNMINNSKSTPGDKKQRKESNNIETFLHNLKNRTSDHLEPETSPVKHLNLMNAQEYTFLDKPNDEYALKSNYSDSTLSLDENPDDLIFYDDGFASNSNCSGEVESLAKGNMSSEVDEEISLLQRSASISSVGSLENEVCLDAFPSSTSPVFGKRTPEPGFFSKYFEKENQKGCERNFDTSKILGECDVSDEENMQECTEICEECGENVPIVEIVSHMDFHLALKLSKENSPLRSRTVDTQVGKVEEQLPKKRKAIDPVKCGITSFFKKEENSEELTELCTECNKKIKLADLDSHSDYHAAKKLHLELNRPQFAERKSIEKNKEEKSVSKRKNDKRVETKANILSFFKQNNS